MPDPQPPRPPPTIDMTIDGRVVAPAPRWTGLLRFWQALPRGALPSLLLATTAVIVCVVMLLGLALLALPVVLLFGALAVVSRLLFRRAPPGS